MDHHHETYMTLRLIHGTKHHKYNQLGNLRHPINILRQYGEIQLDLTT